MRFSLFLFEDKSLFEELWEYIADKYFSVDLGTYENFTVASGGLVTLRGIILGITVGIIIAAGMSVYDRHHLGGFVRKLISEECFDRESAQTLYDLGYYRSPAVRSGLRGGVVFNRWVRCVEEDDFLAELEKKRAEFDEAHAGDKRKPAFKEPKFKRDCNTMHFYIPEEKKITAEIKFDSKGASWLSFFIVAILAVVLCAVICSVLPDVLQLVDNFLSMMNGENGQYMP